MKCIIFSLQDDSGKIAAIEQVVEDTVNSYCTCGIKILSPSISCFDDFSIILRGSVETKVFTYLQEWVTNKAATVQVQGTVLTVDKNCKVAIASLDGAGCIGEVASGAQQTSTPNTTIAIVVVLMIAALIIAAIILAVVITVVKRGRSKRFIVRYVPKVVLQHQAYSLIILV